MTVHSFHPDTHAYGLADECPRCEEHADHPYESLDRRNLSVLSARVIDNLEPRSVNEAKAMDVVREAMRRVDLTSERVS